MPEARQLYAESHNILADLISAEPANASYKRSLAASLTHASLVESNLGEREAQLALLERSLVLCQQHADAAPSNPLAQEDLISINDQLCQFWLVDDVDRALGFAEDAQAAGDELLALAPERRRSLVMASRAQALLGYALCMAGLPEEGEQGLHIGIDTQLELIDFSAPDLNALDALCTLWMWLGECLTQTERHEAARAVYTQLLASISRSGDAAKDPRLLTRRTAAEYEMARSFVRSAQGASRDESRVHHESAEEWWLKTEVTLRERLERGLDPGDKARSLAAQGLGETREALAKLGTAR